MFLNKFGDRFLDSLGIQVEYLNMSEPYHYGIISSQSNGFVELDCRHSWFSENGS